jgi:hypothetical protein
MPDLNPQARAVSYITMMARNHRWSVDPSSKPQPKDSQGKVIDIAPPAIPAAVSGLAMPIPGDVDIAAIAASKSITAQDVAVLLDMMVGALAVSLANQ